MEKMTRVIIDSAECGCIEYLLLSESQIRLLKHLEEEGWLTEYADIDYDGVEIQYKVI